MSSCRINKEKFFQELQDILQPHFNLDDMKQVCQTIDTRIEKMTIEMSSSELNQYKKDILREFGELCSDNQIKKIPAWKTDFVKLGSVYLRDSIFEREFIKRVDYLFNALSIMFQQRNITEIPDLFDSFGKNLVYSTIMTDYKKFINTFFRMADMHLDLEEKFRDCLQRNIFNPLFPKSKLFQPARGVVEPERKMEKRMQCLFL